MREAPPARGRSQWWPRLRLAWVPAFGSFYVLSSQRDGVSVESSAKERLRVLHVILVLGETNGQYNQDCLPLRHERDIAICTYFTPLLQPPPEIELFAGDGSLKGFFRALKAALRAHPYDVIHVHAPQSGGLVMAALLAWRGWRRFGRSLVYTVRDAYYDYRPRNRILTLASILGFGRVIFCSRSALESIPRIFRRAVRHKTWVVTNAVDIDRVDRAIVGIKKEADPSDFRIVWIGRLEEVKDPLGAISVLASVADPSVRMAMIGTGRLASNVAAHVKELGLEDRVELAGLIPREQVFVKCAQADLYLSISHGEGLPVAVLEAMAAECPVVLSDIPPHRELVDGTDFVPLVALGDVEGFAREIRRFKAMTVEERSEIGRRSRQHVLERFNLPKMHAAVEDVYRRTSPPLAARR